MQLCAKFHYWRRPRDGDRDIHVARAESLASGDAESSYIAAREREPRLGRVEFETTRKSDDEGGGRRTRTFRERPSGTPDSQKKIFHQIRAVRSISVVVDRASVCKIDDSHTVPRFDSITSTYIHTRTVLHLTRARHGIGSHRRVRTEGSRSCRPHGRSVRRSVGRTVRLTMSMDRRTADERSREFAATLRSSARSK